MINNVILIGRLVRTPELRETENKNKVTNITVAVPRSFKNPNGEYESDFIDCTLWAGLAETATTFCKKGDLNALKGRLQTSTIEKENIPKMNVINFIVEKLSFLSSKEKTTE